MVRDMQVPEFAPCTPWPSQNPRAAWCRLYLKIVLFGGLTWQCSGLTAGRIWREGQKHLQGSNPTALAPGSPVDQQRWEASHWKAMPEVVWLAVERETSCVFPGSVQERADCPGKHCADNARTVSCINSFHPVLQKPLTRLNEVLCMVNGGRTSCSSLFSPGLSNSGLRWPAFLW